MPSTDFGSLVSTLRDTHRFGGAAEIRARADGDDLGHRLVAADQRAGMGPGVSTAFDRNRPDHGFTARSEAPRGPDRSNPKPWQCTPLRYDET